MLTIKKFEVNPLQENCYILSDATKECLIIDCGALYQSERESIRQYITQNALKPVHLLNTHLHFDHVWGNSFLYSTFGLTTEANAHDQFLYNDVPDQIYQLLGQKWNEEFFAPMGKNLEEGNTINFGTHQLKVIQTPGHTPGGLCFYCEEEKVLFSGDSVFYCSIGRTDLPGGSTQDLINAIREKIITLPEDVKIYPGHGPESSIGTEKRYNSYL